MQVATKSFSFTLLARDQFGAGSRGSGTRRWILVHAMDDGGWSARSIGLLCARPVVRIGNVCRTFQKTPQGSEFRTGAIDAQKVVHIGIGGTTTG